MKSLTEYLDKNFITDQEEIMKVRRIMAPQDSQQEALWTSTKDRWCRKAKHPLQIAEADNMEENIWEKGDIANYNGNDVVVEVPNGPNNTVGILYEGRLKMVLNESLTGSVMGGMQPLSPINRMMQLAGLSVPTIIEPNNSVTETEELADTEKLEEADATNMFQQLMNANSSGEFKNNPAAARLATIGQVLAGLGGIADEMKAKNEMPANVASKIEAAVGLGAFLMQSAKTMLVQ